MSEFRVRVRTIANQKIEENSVTQQHPLGIIVQADDDENVINPLNAGEFIYLKGAANTVVGSWIVYNPGDMIAALLLQSAFGAIGIAMAATVAGEFGWYQIGGQGVGRAVGTMALGDKPYGSGIAGEVTDIATSGDRVQRSKADSDEGTPSAGLALFNLDRPHGDDGTAT